MPKPKTKATLEKEANEMKAALKPLADLLQAHMKDMPTDRPVFQINYNAITVGDLRKARILVYGNDIIPPDKTQFKISAEDRKLIEDAKATLYGEGEWVKDACYRIYKIDERYIAIVCRNAMSLCLDYEGATYIQAGEIEAYV